MERLLSFSPSTQAQPSVRRARNGDYLGTLAPSIFLFSWYATTAHASHGVSPHGCCVRHFLSVALQPHERPPREHNAGALLLQYEPCRGGSNPRFSLHLDFGFHLLDRCDLWPRQARGTAHPHRLTNHRARMRLSGSPLYGNLEAAPIHSARSSITGSTDSARCAGIHVASRPISDIAKTTPARTSGSRGVA
jgi:hypothetical protein